MSGKIKVRMLTVAGLAIILLYTGARTLTTMGESGWQAAVWTSKAEVGLESVLQNLEEFFTRLADTVYAYDDSRNPLVPVSVRAKKKAKASAPKAPAPSKQKPKPQLTGLILDRDPVAIIQIGDKTLTVKRGDYVEGNLVIEIDELGVHLLVEGDVVTIR